MRLWTLHPNYLDTRGLVALWREALLAQAVLRGDTRGYRFHPQLLRFRAQRDPLAAIAEYLRAVEAEAARRGYRFDGTKIAQDCTSVKIPETAGQLLYELDHLKRKLHSRDPQRYRELLKIERPKAHPLFRLRAGGIREWERISARA
jgi:pyrimidine dimer DNA glycosylase